MICFTALFCTLTLIARSIDAYNMRWFLCVDWVNTWKRFSCLTCEKGLGGMWRGELISLESVGDIFKKLLPSVWSDVLLHTIVAVTWNKLWRICGCTSSFKELIKLSFSELVRCLWWNLLFLECYVNSV